MSSPQSIWPTSNHRPVGIFQVGKVTPPTSSHLTEGLYLLMRYIFPENKHKMCLVPICQHQMACHCSLPLKHGFLPFGMLQILCTILVVEKPWLPLKHAMLILVRIFQRNRMESRYGGGAGRGIYFKKLVHAIVGIGKFKLCWTSQQIGNSGRVSVLQS